MREDGKFRTDGEVVARRRIEDLLRHRVVQAGPSALHARLEIAHKHVLRAAGRNLPYLEARARRADAAETGRSAGVGVEKVEGVGVAVRRIRRRRANCRRIAAVYSNRQLSARIQLGTNIAPCRNRHSAAAAHSVHTAAPIPGIKLNRYVKRVVVGKRTSEKHWIGISRRPDISGVDHLSAGLADNTGVDVLAAVRLDPLHEVVGIDRRRFG